jgi:ZIP family zinc transporter
MTVGLGKTMLLGLIAGVTILCGMPVGRISRLSVGVRLVLNAVAVGVLLFLVWDVLSAAWEPIDAALGRYHDNGNGLGDAFGYGALFAAGLAVGLLSLVAYESRLRRGAGASTASPARTTALLIAVGIGLHNFAEGLAIGQSAAAGDIGLATLLVIGFALHNATEGFGIVAPLAGDVDADGHRRRPDWPFLLLLALIGGGPTLVGTIVGHGFTSAAVSVVFLTLAAGSIVYVITQLVGVAARERRNDLLAYGILIGLLAGFATDAVVSAAGV